MDKVTLNLHRNKELETFNPEIAASFKYGVNYANLSASFMQARICSQK